MNQSLEISSTSNFDHRLIINGSNTNIQNYMQIQHASEHNAENFMDISHDCSCHHRLTILINLSRLESIRRVYVSLIQSFADCSLDAALDVNSGQCSERYLSHMDSSEARARAFLE